MRLFIAFFLSFIYIHSNANPKDPKWLIRQINAKFDAVQNYTANVDMQFAIPGVRMSKMNGKVFFKQPDKFRIKAKGIFFLPKQNPIQQISSMLLDTSSYTAVNTGFEMIQNKECAIINIIPLEPNSELILGKFWIQTINPLIVKSQITTKNNGTVETENKYSNLAKYALPDEIILKVEVKKLKMSKMMALDLNKKSKTTADADKLETGSITLQFSNYILNKGISEVEWKQVTP
jgi:hypothetical protein